MSDLRRLIVDTDTGADDVWAIVEALRAKEVVKVEAITTVCGNLPLDLCVKNALLAEEAAGTYFPPVYRGMERPIMSKTAAYAQNVHGQDGLGEMNLPWPDRIAEYKHAVTAIIDIVMSAKQEIEIATCGPLTNLAMALLLEPHLAANIKKVWILGGSANGSGNMTPKAEYNIYVDPEAASIVLNAGIDTTWVTWDSSKGEAEITPEELKSMQTSDDCAARFCARCVYTLREYQKKHYKRDSLGVIDSMLMTVVLYPEIQKGAFQASCSIDTTAGEYRGFFGVDHTCSAKNGTVCTVCPQVHAELYKKHLFSLLGVQLR